MQAAGGQAGRALTDDELIGEIFSYHQPNSIQGVQMTVVVAAAVNMAKAIKEHCPSSPDRTEAFRCLRLASMWAKASISLNGMSLR
jgi:hypothetical protein